MKKRFVLLLLILAACAKVQEPVVPSPIPVIEAPVPTLPPVVVEYEPKPVGNIGNFVIVDAIHPYLLVSTDIERDNFGIIPVVRYDAEYQGDFPVLVHVFEFASRQELDVVLNSEFYYVISEGTYSHRGKAVALYLTQDEHRVALWPSGNLLVYIETFIPNFAAVEIVDAYMAKHSSDLKTARCIDTDGNEHRLKGKTSMVQIGSSVIEWEDVCLKDFAAYRNGQYSSQKGLNPESGLLEGRCVRDSRLPGFIDEYACPKGCEDGACK